MWSRKFWQATATRAVRTAAQVLLGFLVVDVAVWSIDWKQALGVSGTAVLASVCMSLLGPAGPDKDTGDSGTPDGAVGTVPVYAQRDDAGGVEITADVDAADYVGKRRRAEQQEAPPGGDYDEPRV